MGVFDLGQRNGGIDQFSNSKIRPHHGWFGQAKIKRVILET